MIYTILLVFPLCFIHYFICLFPFVFFPYCIINLTITTCICIGAVYWFHLVSGIGIGIEGSGIGVGIVSSGIGIGIVKSENAGIGIGIANSELTPALPAATFVTLRPRQNGRLFTDEICTFSSIKMYECGLIFHWSLFPGVKLTNIGSHNGLAPTRPQTIIWTNDV